MRTAIQSIKGTRDFYPEDMALRSWLHDMVRRVSESFGYQEYDAPLIESIDLYAAKSGEELVKEQSFVFPDRGGDLIALRPELTPSLARMVAQRQQALAYPLRWWSWGPFWRYESPQKGRGREFYQWNIDLIGPDSPEADAELVAIAATFFREAGVSTSDVSILVNDRRLINGELARLGVAPEERMAALRLIDRRDKLSGDEWRRHGLSLGLGEDQLDGLEAVLADHDLWRKSPEMERFFAAIEAHGLGAWVRYAPHVIRGLQYYTGTVFEAWDLAGEFRALFGGGRYDDLVADVGGERLPGVGFAMGDMVAGLLLRKLGRVPADLGRSRAEVLVTVFDAALQAASLALASELRATGLRVATYPEPTRLARQLKYADRTGIAVAAVLGPDELAGGTVALKDLRRGQQQAAPRAEAAEAVRRLLAGD